MKCHMPNPCVNCDMSNMDENCDLNCEAHCLGSNATVSNTFTLPLEAAISTKITTVFKHFYLHTSSPELRPPLF